MWLELVCRVGQGTEISTFPWSSEDASLNFVGGPESLGHNHLMQLYFFF